MNKIKNILKNKRTIYMSSILLLIMFSLTLNFAFSAFTNKERNILTKIKVNDMSYGVTINGNPGTIIIANKNDITKSNLVISSLNKIDSKYELTYEICLDINCNNIVIKPEGLEVEYSSRTIDNISGTITASGSKQIRVVTTNTTDQIYYVKIKLNAGYVHNTLALENLIIKEYNEEDIIIAAIVDGEISTTFPTTKDYDTKVTCTTNNGLSNATGTVTWNDSKWVLNVTGVDSGRTICNIEFNEPSLRDKVISQGGGLSAITARGTPDFHLINGTSGLYAADDEYGTSYYYRGIKTELNNNLIWARFQWKIVRINGDGSIRLIYNGTEEQFNSINNMNDLGENTHLNGYHVWNLSHRNDAKYVGYMYGGANGLSSTRRNGTTSAAATYNETSSNVKQVLENWYQTNLSNKSFENEIVDNLFCNDRQLQSEVGGQSTGPGYGNTTSYFSANQRLKITQMPTFKCGLKNDRFTVSDKTIGNGALTYPVGLLTADEASKSGLVYGNKNTLNYLYNQTDFWTMQPFQMDNVTGTYVIVVENNGSMTASLTELGEYDIASIRPVLSIKSTTKVTGTGSATDPFKVK